MQRGREAANLGSLGLGAGQQSPTGHRAALARGWDAGRAESRLPQGHEERITTSSTLLPRAPGTVFFSSQKLCNTPRPTWRVLFTLFHRKGLLGTMERARIMPRLIAILSMGIERS